MFGIQYGNTQTSEAAATVASEIAKGIEHMSYRDCSRITKEEVKREEGILPDAFASSTSPWSKEPPFPLKLHRILSEQKCKSAIVWLEHGRAWRVVDSKELERMVLSQHFKQSQISSFMRQVTGWGFRRVTSGKDEGAYYHDCFLRGLPHICLKMRRLTGKRSKFGRISVSPDFYAMSERHPLPDEDGNMPATSPSLEEPKEQPEDTSAAPTGAQPEPQEQSSGSVSQSSTIGGVNALQGTTGFSNAGMSNNVSLPQHLLAATQQPSGLLPANPLLLQNFGALFGAGALGGNINTMFHPANPLPLQQLQSINLNLMAASLQQQQQQQQQQGTAQPTAKPAAPPEPLRLQPLELLSAASAVRDYARCKESDLTHAPSTETPKEESKSSSMEANRADAATSSNRAFVMQRKFQETSSGSSSSAGLNESGSESSTIQNTEGQEQDDSTSTKSKEDSSGDGSINSSSSSVSMSEMGSDSGAQPTKMTGEETDGKELPGEGAGLRRHLSSRQKSVDQTTSSMSSSESGSDTNAQQQPAFELQKTKFGEASDQSSSSVANSADSCESSLRKLWDLVSSADESNGSPFHASHLVKTSKGLVGILVGDEESGLESDTNIAQTSVQKAKVASGVEGDEEAERDGAPGGPDKPSLDIAAKAMTMGILWGMGRGRAGNVPPPATAVTNSGSSRGSPTNVDGDFDVESILTNSSLHSSIAAALSRQKMQMQRTVTSSDTGSGDRRSSFASSDEGEKQNADTDAKKNGTKHRRPDSERARAASDDKATRDERQKHSSKATFGPPTEVAWGHKRKAPSADTSNMKRDDEPDAKRRARNVSCSGSESRVPPSSGHTDEANAKKAPASSSTRRKAGIIRSLSSLTTPLEECSALPASKLTKGRRLSTSAPSAHSTTSSQPSDISGEDFETGSSQSWQSGSGWSNAGDPAATSSDVFSGSTSHAPGSSAESTESVSGDDGVCAKVKATREKQTISAGPAKKRKISSVGWHGVER